jgi:hypothetical protein
LIDREFLKALENSDDDDDDDVVGEGTILERGDDDADMGLS